MMTKISDTMNNNSTTDTLVNGGNGSGSGHI